MRDDSLTVTQRGRSEAGTGPPAAARSSVQGGLGGEQGRGQGPGPTGWGTCLLPRCCETQGGGSLSLSGIP